MPWKDKTVKELRKEFISAAKESTNFSSLCREYGITRKTGYKWLERAETTGNLSDRSHAPLSLPGKTPREIEETIIKLRLDNPGWGGKKILQVLENQGYTNLPCIRTANNILKRNNCVSPEDSAKHTAFVRFQREHCNEMWQTDFKGDFALLNDERCFPFDILDDCSRFCLRLEAKSCAQGVQKSFENTFREYGMPKSILSDNGAQFAGFRGGYTQFERWLMDLDITPIHGRIVHPQTQGKIERFHRSMKDELLKHRAFADLNEAASALRDWREKYNNIRPHEALGMKCPADIYTASKRKYPDKIRDYEYSGTFRLIKVNNRGYLRFDDIRVYLSETMADTRVEVRAVDGDIFEVYYRNYRIAQIDAHEKKLVNRHISRTAVPNV